MNKSIRVRIINYYKIIIFSENDKLLSCLTGNVDGVTLERRPICHYTDVIPGERTVQHQQLGVNKE